MNLETATFAELLEERRRIKQERQAVMATFDEQRDAVQAEIVARGEDELDERPKETNP